MTMAACNEQEPAADREHGVLTVTFSAPQWGETQNDTLRARTRGQMTANGKQMTDLWVLDYLDGELQAQIHQTSDQADFAEPRLTMKFGDHRLYFVASRGTDPTLSTADKTVVWEKTSDTFWKAVTLNVGQSTRTSQTVVMDRVVTSLRIKVLDAIPDGAASLTLKPAHWYYGLDYTTGSPVGDSDKNRTISIPASYIGQAEKLQMEIFGLCGAEGYATDVAVTAADGDGNTLGQVGLTAVPLVRNRVTVYSGLLFNGQSGFTLSVSDEWEPDHEATW